MVEFYSDELRTQGHGSKTFLLDLGPSSIVRTLAMRPYHSPNAAYTWIGDVPGVHGSSILFVATPDMAYGSIQLRDTLISVNQIENGLGILTVQVMAPEPPEQEPPPDTSAVPTDTLADYRDVPPLRECPTALYVDVLVTYTPQARTDYEELRTTRELPSLPPSIGIYSLLAVEQFNVALDSAGIRHRLRLRDTVLVDIPDDVNLIDLATSMHRHADVRRHRKRVDADIVALWAEGDVESPCGYQPVLKQPQVTGSALAYPVTRVRGICLENLTFPHEIGHALGLAHDRETAMNRPGAEPWTFGYRDPVAGFGTLMAYENCPPRNGCRRLPILSDSRRMIQNRPAGVHPDIDPANAAMDALTVGKTMCAAARFSRVWSRH